MGKFEKELSRVCMHGKDMVSKGRSVMVGKTACPGSLDRMRRNNIAGYIKVICTSALGKENIELWFSGGEVIVQFEKRLEQYPIKVAPATQAEYEHFSIICNKVLQIINEEM